MIGRLRHKLHLCSQQDVVNDGQLRLNRQGVLEVWAEVKEKSAQRFSPFGANMDYSQDTRTHVVTTRYRSDIDISALAWLYEKRLKSPPRWFKILKINVTECTGSQYAVYECRLVESKDGITEPKPQHVVNLPDGVKL